MAGLKYIVNREYLKGWQSNLIGFFVIMIAFFCFEPIITSGLKEKIIPFLIKCNTPFLWILVTFLFIWLIYKACKGYKENSYVSLRSFFLFALPLFLTCFFYGIVKDFFPSFEFQNGIKVSSVIALSIPMGIYMTSVFSCCYKVKESTSFFKKYKYTHDIAIKEKKDDKFGYDTYVEKLAQGVKSTNVSTHSYSLAITGEWGSGKTSFMNMLSGELKDENDTNIMWFNPRQSKSWECIQEDFMMQLYGVIKKYSQTPSVGNAVLRYIGELNIDSSWGFVKTLLNDVDRMLHENGRNEIERILKHRAKPLYIFIDDLDRLTAVEMMEVFKLINKNAAFPYFYFITALDKSRVNHMLSKHLGLEKVENYSDKYFNSEYHLPEKDYFKVVGNMTKLLKDKAKAYHLHVAGKIISYHWQNVQRKTVLCLLTPRDLIRFCNEFMAAYSQVADDVCFEDLWYLMLIKYKDQKTYEDIVSRNCLISLKQKDVVFYGLDIRYALGEGKRIYGSAVYELLKTLFPEVDYDQIKGNNVNISIRANEFLNSPSYKRLYIRKHTNTYLALNAGNDCVFSELEKFFGMTNEESEVWLGKLCIRHKYIVYSYLIYKLDEGHLTILEQKRIFVLLMIMFGQDSEYFAISSYLRKFLKKDESFVKMNESKGDPDLNYVKRCVAYLLRKDEIKKNIINLIMSVCSDKEEVSRMSVKDTLEVIKKNTDIESLDDSNMLSYTALATVKPVEFAQAIMSVKEGDTIHVFNHLVPIKKMCKSEYGFDTEKFVNSIVEHNNSLASDMRMDADLNELL